MPFLLLMPSYNQAHYIAEAVRSVLAQDDPDWELWIVDNSTDTTPEVMRAFSDPRIHFHHIPERMDPGTCLNWMLERARGTMFSYLHTDNNLHPSYVRRFREALAGKPLGLAHCDMRVINGKGRYTRVHRRGTFDFPRLISLDPLGAPFAATTELARQVGGFSVRDVADDVRFCIAAYGLAEYIHVREPVLDYRAHEGSRTTDAGGVSGMREMFLKLFVRMLPELEARGLGPRPRLARELAERLDDLEWLFEDWWHRDLNKALPAWWEGAFKIDHLFTAGLLHLPRMQPGRSAPAWSFGQRDHAGHRLNPMRSAAVRLYLRLRERDPRRLAERALQVLLPWACMQLGVEPKPAVSVRLRSLDFRTVWAARQLEAVLGWEPRVDPTIVSPPWLQWPAAKGDEPLLDLLGEPRLERR